MEDKVPVIIVTGFLGSGKTTLLNKILADNPDKKIALILNEFGDISLESQFIEKDGIPIAEIAGGCMCCIAKNDVPRAINVIFKNQEVIDYIIIEASGLSDPDPIREVFKDYRLVDKIKLEKIICIVDAVNFFDTKEDHQIVMSQIADASTIVISKVTEIEQHQVDKVERFMKNLLADTHIYLWNKNFSSTILFENKTLTVEVEDVSEKHEHDHEDYDEFWFNTSKEIDKEKLTQAYTQIPDNVVRSKGVVNVGGDKYLVQYTPQALKLLPDQWKEKQPYTSILFLGKELDRDRINDLMRKAEK